MNLAAKDPEGRFLRWATLVAVACVWEFVVAVVVGRNDFFATPVGMLTAIPGLLSGAVLSDIAITAEEFGIALVIAIVLGCAVGVILGSRPGLSRTGQRVLRLAFAVPQVALYSLFVLWVGVGEQSKILFGVTHGVFPVALAVAVGAGQADPSLVKAVRAMGGGRWRVVRDVVVPGMVPDLIAGCRIGAALCLLGVLLGELMISTAGVGQRLSQLSSALRPNQLDALIFLVFVMAIIINSGLGLAERRVSGWRGAGAR